jgi:photosystem II stability/assembly factor-like uncharacterized protein
MKKKLATLFVAGLAFSLTFLLSTAHRPAPSHKTPDEREDNAREMFEWWYNQRAFPYDLIPQGAFQKAASYAKTKMRREAKGPFSGTATPPWVSIGPNNVGGRTLSIAVDPVHSNVVWAGSASGGLWKSTTGGEGATAWSYVPTGYPTLSVSAIAIDPGNTNVIYIGTGEIGPYRGAVVGTPGARSSYGMGILKSTNGGASWAQTSLTWTFSQITAVEKIAINPRNSKTLYAATSEGVYKSVDAGANWTLTDATLMAMDIAINPSDTAIVYATHGNLNSTALAGLYQTLDAGGEWFPLANGLPGTDFGRAAISICTSHPSTVYLAVANATTGAAFGLFRSDDDGGFWAQVSDSNFTSAQGWYDIAVGVKPTDRFTVFTSGLDIYRSTTGGDSPIQGSYWFQGAFGPVPPGGPEGPSSYAHADHHAITFDPSHPDTIYFGCDGGVFKTTDGGDTFFGCNGGYVTTQFYNGFANAVADSQVALGGLQDNGVVKYEGSTTWNKVDGGDGGWCAIDPTNAGILYDEYVFLSLKKSVNGGGFNPITNGLPTGGAVSNFIAPFGISPSDATVLYAGNKNVYKTTNGGDSWYAPNGGANLNGTRVASIGISYTSSDTLMAATGSPTFQVFASTNGGQSWTNVTGTLPNRYPTDIEFDPNTSSTVYMTFSGYGTGHLYRSTNVGQSWTNITSNLPDIPHQSVVVDPAQPSNIYVGTDLGVYHSSDGGTLWEDFSSGMMPAMVLDMTVSRSNAALRAATFGNGVFERKLARVASIALAAPVGGEVWLGGQPALIRWSELLVSLLKIEYSTDDGGTWYLVADNVPGASGQYAWTLPSIATTHARVRISQSGSGSPAASSTSSFTITLTPDVTDGWNLSSLRLRPLNNRKSILFPTATTPAFAYASSYVVRDSLNPGEGFWMKFSGAQLTPYAGDSLAADTIQVHTGWNLIGALSRGFAVSSVVQIPPGIVITPFFGYGGSYGSITTLQPGKGYWVKVNSDGQLVIHSGSASAPSSPPSSTQLAGEFGSFTSLLIGDAGGRSQTLYLAPGADRSASFALPPVPPEGGFDARFSGGNLVEFPDANSRPNSRPDSRKDIPILISTTLFPVTISWTIRPGMAGVSLLVDGRVIGMRGSGSATIPGPQSSVSVRIAEQETKPVQYSLGQNYPNPFNPKTVFPFVLAHPSVVTLKVYDVGGREVATLLSRQSMGTGRQQAEFDASMLSSGVYLYRLIAEPAEGDRAGEGFEGVRKMLLLR